MKNLNIVFGIKVKFYYEIVKNTIAIWICDSTIVVHPRTELNVEFNIL